METLNLEIGGRPRVRLVSIGGDLRLVGQAGTRLRAQAPSKGDLKVATRDDETVITCASSCMLFLPEAAEIVVETVEGDVRAHALTGSLNLGQVHGDLSVRRCANLHAERVSGGLVVRKLERGLAVTWIGGDGQLEQVEGGVQIGQVEGDLVAHNVVGVLSCACGGDVHLEWKPTPQSTSQLTCLGDLHCRLLPGASVAFQLQASGDMDLGKLQGTPSPQGLRVTLGDGEAEAAFQAGGDLRLRAAGQEFAFPELEGLQEDLDDLMRTHWEEALSGIEEAGALAGGFDPQRIARQIRRSVDQVQRHVPRVAAAARSSGEVSVPSSSPGAKSEPVAGEERLAILRMLEHGKINVDQAEQLLHALEGKT
jgi:hypothetical protein